MPPYRLFCKKREYSPLAETAFTIGDDDGRIVDDAFSRLPGSPAKVDVLEEEEEPRIETAEFLIERASQEQACPRDPVDFLGPTLIRHC